VELSSQNHSCPEPVAVSCAEGSVSHTDIGAQSAVDAECNQRVMSTFTNVHSDCSSKQCPPSAGHLLEETEAAGEHDKEQYSETTFHQETDKMQSVVTVSAAAEVGEVLSCSSVNTKRQLQTNDAEVGRTCHEVAQKNENNYDNDHRCRIVCEDDFSVFFGSPVSVPSVTAKLKNIPKRKAVSMHNSKITSDCIESCDHALACDELTFNRSVNCIEFPEQDVLPLPDALTSNFDKPGVCVHVTSNEQSTSENSVGHSSSIQLSLPITTTTQCLLPPSMNASTSGIVQSSSCLSVTCSVEVLPSSCINLVVPLQDQRSSSVRSVSSALYQPPFDNRSSVSVLDKWSCNDTSVLESDPGMQVNRCGGYSDQPLQKQVKNKCVSNHRFLYPSAAQVYHSRDDIAFEHITSDRGILPAKRSTLSLLYTTPSVLQSTCTVAHSKAEEHMNKTASLGMVNNEGSCSVKEITVVDSGESAELVLNSQCETLMASNIVSCGLNSIAVTSFRNAMNTIESVNKDSNTACDGIGMAECMVVETSSCTAQKMPLQDVPTQSPVSLPSLADGVCCSELTCDFAGQTSPGLSSRTTLYDVGVQTTLASESTSNVSKWPLFVNAAVQTVSACCTHCSCHKFSHSCDFNTQKSSSPARSELWQDHALHDGGFMRNDVNCNLRVHNISNRGTCENSSPSLRFAFQSAGVFGDESSVEKHDNLSLLRNGSTDTVSNQTVSAENTTCVSTTVSYGNRCTVTADAIVDHLPDASRYVVSNESSVNCIDTAFLPSANMGELRAIERETASADCVKPVISNWAQDVNDVTVKCTSGVSIKSFSTGFVSAGGKPLNVKLSSKRNACKLLDDLACAEDDSLNTATDTPVMSHFSVTGLSASVNDNADKVGKDLTRKDTASFEYGDAIVLNSTKQSTGNQSTFREHVNVSADYSTVSCGLLQKSHSKDLMSNGFKPFKAPRASVQSSKQEKNKSSTETDDGCLFDTSVSESNTVKAEDRVRNVDEVLCNLTNTQRAEVMDASLLMLNSAEVFAVSCSDEVHEVAAEQCVSYNSAAAAASVGDCPSVSNISAHVDSVPEHCSPVSTMLVDTSIGTCENFLTSQLQTACDEANAESVSSDTNTKHSVACPVVCSDSAINMGKSESGQIYNIKQNAAFCFLTAGGSVVSVQEDDLRAVAECYNKPTVLVDAGYAETNPVPVVSLPCNDDEETDADQVTCHRTGSCINDVSCMSGSENQTDAESFRLSGESLAKSNTKHLHDDHMSRFVRDERCFQNTAGIETYVNNKAKEMGEDDVTNKNSPFVFFSAKGSRVNVSEKTLRNVRQNWSNLLTDENSICMESRTPLKVADVNEQLTDLHSSKDFILQANTDDMGVSSVASDSFSSCTEHVVVDVNCNRKINANKADEYPSLSSAAISIHSADVPVTSVMDETVSWPNIKSVHNVADTSSGCVAVVSANTSDTSGLSTSVPVSCVKAAEYKLPFRATVSCSDVDKCHVDRNIIAPLHTVPESK